MTRAFPRDATLLRWIYVGPDEEDPKLWGPT